MKLYKKYLAGETKAVYDEIHELGDKAFSMEHMPEIEKVLTETFERVAYNLRIIYQELLAIGYQFKTNPEFNFEKSLHLPLENTNSLIQKIDSAIAPFGYIPLSLKYFYRLVGGVNFTWDYAMNKNLMWNVADPIWIASIDSIADDVTNKFWAEEIQEYIDYDILEHAFLELSADELHKDNISGNPSYIIEITKKPSIDGNFLREPNDTTFINYLRICFDNCGFPGLTRNDLNDHQAFFDIVKPKLKKI
ncbi:MAG: hypothetical protein COA58_15710 [Bacteroidetes bacterium]|nr:MAG: hypothetical protein COA58_15710 [Bacteroidota bacterium]